MISDIRARLNARLGERVFLDAMRDVAEGAELTATRVGLAAKAVAFGVLATPYLAMGLGAVLVAYEFPTPGLIFIGGVLIGLGWFVRPRKIRLPKELYLRADFPKLFGFFDDVAEAAGGPRVDLLELTADFNAWTWRVARDDSVILSLGLTLWRALPPEGRVALIAHELAHHVNGDPARSRLEGRAIDVLNGWLSFFEEPDFVDEYGNRDDGGLVGDFIRFFLGAFRWLVHGVSLLLMRLICWQSNRAEYLADALAARVAGVGAMLVLLETVMMKAEIEDEGRSTYVSGSVEGTAFLDRFVGRIHGVSEARRTEILAAARNVKLAVDTSHPPTAYRIEFVKLFEDVAVFPIPDMEEIDAELAQVTEDIGRRFADEFRNE